MLQPVKFENNIYSHSIYKNKNILKNIFDHKYLLWLFVKRDFVTNYKQTILGPLWFFIQPIFTTIIFTVIFGNFAGISTDGIPKVLFYLSGLVLWNFFADCLLKTSDTFNTNQHIFGKVYFPRIIIPISIIISNLLKLAIQFSLFIGLYIYYLIFTENDFNLNYTIIFIPALILIISMFGLGLGILITSLTTKYRDLKFLIQFGVQLLMYSSPIIYPINSLTGNLKTIILLNPVSSIIECFKYAFFGLGEFNFFWLAYSTLIILTILFISIYIFNRIERNFMDTI